jgi:hypothetical protein
VLAKLGAMAEEYGAERSDIEERVTDVLFLPDSATPAEQTAAARKAEDKLFIHLLALWSSGKVQGRETPEALEKQAKRHDSVAQMIRTHRTGDAADIAEKVEAQESKAAALRARAAEMAAQRRAAEQQRSDPG